MIIWGLMNFFLMDRQKNGHVDGLMDGQKHPSPPNLFSKNFESVHSVVCLHVILMYLKMVILIEVVTESVWNFSFFFFLYSGGLSDVPCEERFVFVFVRKLSCYRKQLKIRSPLANYSEFRASFRSKDGDPKAFFRSKDGNPGSSFRSQEKYNLESRPLNK